jgi:PAS domain S-box-containing protein
VPVALTIAVVLSCAGIAIALLVQRGRRAAQRALAEASGLLRSSLESVAQGISIFDGEQRLIAWNSRFLELRRLNGAEVRAGMRIDEIAACAAPLEFNSRGSRGDGRILHVSSAAERVPFDGEAARPDGAVLRICGRPMSNGHYVFTYADVTDLRQSETAYREQAQYLSSLLDNLLDAVVTADSSGTIQSWSHGAERLFGYKSEEVLRRNVAILLPNSSPPYEEFLRRFLETHGPFPSGVRREFEVLHKDGRRIPVEVGISDMSIRQRRVFTLIVRDLSERREVERMKSSFVSTVSHELRTPLTSISGSLGLLAGGAAGELSSAASRLIGIASQNCERLIRLINDILDLEKADAGRLAIKLERQHVQLIVLDAIEANRAFAKTFGVTIELDPRSDDAPVLVDRDRFIQVLTNLLSNAAKFSPPGGVVCVRIAADRSTVCVAVHDNGPGIPASFRPNVFQKFAQADSSDSRTKGGTGLGLSIAKTLMERLGGTIAFDSAEGQGTTFRVTLPACDARTATRNAIA